MSPEEIQSMIQQGFPSEFVTVSGEGCGISVIVVSNKFEGVSTLSRHRKVYATLGDKVGVDIHALSIKAFTPEEYKAQ